MTTNNNNGNKSTGNPTPARVYSEDKQLPRTTTAIKMPVVTPPKEEK